MRPYTLLALILLWSTVIFARSTDKRDIRALLARQVQAWNRGDIAGYMNGYWESDSLLFIGKSGPTYGYAPTLERYRKAYPDTAHMGQLTSTIVSMKRLSREYYFIVGKWALKRSAGDVGGSWTLLLRKIRGAWVIVADHSS